MSVLLSILHGVFIGFVYISMLLVLVAAHELGHYLFARLFGMAAEEFAIGMGGRKPLIYGRRRYIVPVAEGEDPKRRGDESNVLEGGGATVAPVLERTPDGGEILHETTLFTLRPLPLGGFVRIKGMMPEEDGGETRIPGGFFSKAPWKRWIVLAAGPAFSVIAGILLLVPVLAIYGDAVPTGRPVLGGVTKEGAAYKAGLRAGDRIVSVDGVPVSSWYDLVRNVRDKGTKPIAVVALHDGKRTQWTMVGTVGKKPTPVVGADGKLTDELRRQTLIGAIPETKQTPVPLREALSAAVRYPYVSTAFLVERLSRPAELAENLGGPGTMIRATSDAVDEGIWGVIRLAGLLSISVGIFNLLPFPPLDGGQMWIAFVEILRGGRRLSMRTQIRVLNLGFAMVVLLIGTVLVIDVRRLSGLSGDAPPTIERGR